MPIRPRKRRSTKWSLMLSLPISTACPRIPAVAAGRGIPAPPAGCTAWVWKPSWVFHGWAKRLTSIRASLAHWTGFKVDYRFGTTHYVISVENPHNVNRGIRQVLLDGNPLSGNLVPLVEDGRRHDVQVKMG